MKREFSAGGVVYKTIEDGVRWLIRRPMPNEGYRGNLGWNFPKGWIDDADDGKKPGVLASGLMKATNADLERAALREVEEEAGVRAEIVGNLGTIKIYFTDQGGEKVMKFVTYFLMKFTEELPGGFGFETEEVKWVTSLEAQEMLAYKSERELITKAVKGVT